IVWQGHPAEMDDEIVKLTGDKRWGEIAEKLQQDQDKRMKLLEKYARAAKKEKWDDALAALDDLTKLDPSDPTALLAKYVVLATGKKDTMAAEEVSTTILANVDEAPILNELAWRILTDDAFEDVRDLKLANALAEKAVKITGAKDPAILDTLARAKYDAGNAEEAIELQKKAVKLAKGPMKEELEKTLMKYEKGEKSSGKKEKDKKDKDDDDD